MDINILNKKRKFIKFISVSLTILIVVIATIFLIIGNYNTYFYIASPIILIAGLFILAKFLVIPKYENLKMEILKSFLNDRYHDVKIKKHKDYFKYMDNFYDNKITKKDNLYSIIIKGQEFKTLIYNKRFTKNSAVTFDFSGIVISCDLNKKLNEATYIRLNEKNSTQIINFLEGSYKNYDDSLSSNKKYYRYGVYYNDKYDLEIIDLFNDFPGPNLIKIDDKFMAIIDTKIRPIEFKIQDNLTSNNIIDFKNQCEPLFKLLDVLLKWRDSNV